MRATRAKKPGYQLLYNPSEAAVCRGTTRFSRWQSRNGFIWPLFAASFSNFRGGVALLVGLLHRDLPEEADFRVTSCRTNLTFERMKV